MKLDKSIIHKGTIPMDDVAFWASKTNEECFEAMVFIIEQFGGKDLRMDKTKVVKGYRNALK